MNLIKYFLRCFMKNVTALVFVESPPPSNPWNHWNREFLKGVGKRFVIQSTVYVHTSWVLWYNIMFTAKVQSRKVFYLNVYWRYIIIFDTSLYLHSTCKYLPSSNALHQIDKMDYIHNRMGWLNELVLPGFWKRLFEMMIKERGRVLGFF